MGLPVSANLRVACVWVQRLSGSGLARGAIGGRDMQLEHPRIISATRCFRLRTAELLSRQLLCVREDLLT